MRAVCMQRAAAVEVGSVRRAEVMGDEVEKRVRRSGKRSVCASIVAGAFRKVVQCGFIILGEPTGWHRA